MIAVVDDDEHARAACCAVLADREVVAFETARAAVAAARAGTLPRVVLMDMHLPGESAGKAIAAIRAARPDTLVIALTSHASDDYVFEALRAGAIGYVLKARAPEELAEAVRIAEAGGSPLSPGIARRIIATFEAAGDPDEPLSRREEDILRAFADGAGYQETADRLGIAVDTVRTHVRRMYAKLHVSSRTGAVLAGIRRGLLGPRR